MSSRSWRRLLVPPGFRVLERRAIAAVALGGLALGTTALFAIGEEEPAVPFVVGLSTAVLSLVVACFLLPAATRPSDLTLPVLVWCTLAGVLNAPTSLLASAIVVGPQLLRNDHLPTLAHAGTLLRLLVVGPLGALLGMLFGALYLMPLRRAVSERSLRSVDGGDRTAATAGAWLASTALLALAFVLLWSTVESLRPRALGAAASGCCLLCLAGVAATVAASSRRRLRLALLDRVRAGEVEGLAVLPRAALCAEVTTLPTLGAATPGEAEALDGVLVEYRPGAGCGVYRSRDDVALCPLAVVRLARVSHPSRG